MRVFLAGATGVIGRSLVAQLRAAGHDVVGTTRSPAATVRALDHGAPGVYNVVDDEPAPQHAWMPALAAVAGGKPPRHVPAWLARLAAGPFFPAMAEHQRGASNAKARAELAWTPRYPSWREGFTTPGALG